MAEETPVLISIGKRVYRKYPVVLQEPTHSKFQENNLRLLEEDDGEGEEEIVNLDVKDYEDLMQDLTKKYVVEEPKIESSIIETIFYDSQMSAYTLYNKLNNRQHFTIIIGACSLDRTEYQKRVESETHTVLKGNIKDLTVEIRGNSPDFVMNANEMILNFLNKTQASKPSEYNVINQKTRKLVMVLKPSDLNPMQIEQDEKEEEEKKEEEKEIIEIEEYPELQMNWDNKWKGYKTIVKDVPQPCLTLLLANKGQNLKSLKSKMKNNVEFLINKSTKVLEIIGYTKDQVKEGYANFIKLVKTDQKAMKSWGSNKKQKRFTHFFALSMENDPNIAKAQQEALTCRIGNFKNEWINTPNKFHLTLALMNLESTDQTVSLVNNSLDSIKQSLQGSPLNLTFDKVGFFGKPTAAHVLFLDLKQDAETDKMNQMNSVLIKTLMDGGIISQEDLKNQQTKFVGGNLEKAQHMTLAKCSRGQKMDVSDVLARNFVFDIKVSLASIELLSMEKEGKDSSYPVVQTFSLI